MDPLNSRVELIFFEAEQYTDPVLREQYIKRACASDEALHAQVEKLLAASEQAEKDDFLSASPEHRLKDLEEAVVALPIPTVERSGERIGRYRLIEQLGEGGFGVVWMAEQEEPVRRAVALKIIKLGMDTCEVIARFEQERQALALMEHPNIARVLDAGSTSGGRPFFVMELVRGVPLTRYCDENNLSMDDRLKLFVQVCQGVQHAHQKGIIHRDLKPSNVLVMLQDGGAVSKVIDFGIAKATQSKLIERTIFTRRECMIGTPLYMSPEQAGMRIADIDTRSDIYSLGVLLYELLTGRTPFAPNTLIQRSLDEIYRVIREDEPPKPSTALSTIAKNSLTMIARARRMEVPKLISALKGDLDWIVMRALEKDRSRRYDTATGLAQDIQRHLRREPVLARPPSQLYRFQRTAARNKLAFGAAAAIATGLIICVVISTWLAIRASNAEETALNTLAEVVSERDAKERALQQARAAEADTRAFGDFLVNRVLAAGRPQDVEGGLGADIKITRALEEAEAHMESDFGARPRAEALARDAIGVTWESLGRYDQAKRQLLRAVELRKQELGLDHPETLMSINNLGVALERTGEVDEALRLYQLVLERRQATLGADDPSTLTSMNNLASAYYDSRVFQKAISLYEATLEKSRAVLGASHPNTLKSINNLARAYKNTGRIDRATRLYEEALRIGETNLGGNHPYTLTSMNNLAVCYEEAGDFPKALPLYEKAMERSNDKLGADHPDTLTSMDNLAVAYEKAGDLQKALSLYERSLEKRRGKLGDSHADTLSCMNNVAFVYTQIGKFENALPLYVQILESRKRKLGMEDPATLKSMNNLALAYEKTGELQKASALYELALERSRAKLGANDTITLTILENLARTYGEKMQFDKSLESLERLLAEQKEILGEGDPQVSRIAAQIETVRHAAHQYKNVEHATLESGTKKE